MIGTYARSIRHFERSVGTKQTKVLINSYGNIANGCALNTKMSNGRKILALFQNIGGDSRRGIGRFANDEIPKIETIMNDYGAFFLGTDELSARFSDIIILPDNFDEVYDKFCKSNRKLLDQVFGRLCGSKDAIAQYIFAITGDKPNLFVWALSNIYKHRISLFLIKHILNWNETYGKLSSKLAKGTITAYNGDNVFTLKNELNQLRREKRANDSINMFNTFQKKALKTVELSPRILSILNKFGRLSKVKKINFVRKMSTIDSTDEIIKQMSFLTNSQFDWNKESLIEYINNTDNINAEIIEDKGDILLVKVNDYETVKYLARATNWCISKNKKYWNDYVEFRDNASQYIIFDFSKKEDDKLSIVGFTTDNSAGITNAHNYTNDNLMGDGEMSDRILLKSFMPQISNNIFSILKRDNLNINKLINSNTLHYEWNKDSFISFLRYSINENNYIILHEDENSIVLNIKDENIRHLIGKGYNNVVGNDDTLYNIILFADFNYDEYEKNKLLWGLISKNDKTHEESCNGIYNSCGQNTSFIIDDLFDKYDLPYDTICRMFNKQEVFKDSLISLNLPKINSFLKDKEFISKFKESKDYNSNIPFSALNSSAFRFMSFDFINAVYDNGLELTDIINNRRMNQFISNLMSTIVDFFFDNDNHIPTKKDIEDFNNGNLNYSMSKYIGFLEMFKLICSKETKNEIFKDSIYNFMDGEYDFTLLIAPMLAQKVNLDNIVYQERFFNAICQHNCMEALNIILSRNPKKPILDYFLSILPDGKMKNKILESYKEYKKEMSFSIS